MQYAHKENKLIVGKMYMVAHARIRYDHNGASYDVPVLPHKHTDPQFGYAGSFEHYHIDGRFNIPGDLWVPFQVEANGKSNCVVYVDSSIHEQDHYTYRVVSVIFKRRKCMRLTTGTKPPMRNRYSGEKSGYLKWYDGFVGKTCKGKKCPHFGTNMIEKGDGVLVCPMHDIHASAKTLKVIEHPKRDTFTHC